MPALIRKKRSYVVIATTAVMTSLLVSGVAEAKRGDQVAGGSDTGNPKDPSLSASASAVRYDPPTMRQGTAAHPAGTLQPVGNWSPPACWYQPTYTPAQLKASSEYVWGEDSPGYEWKQKQRDYYADGHPYTDFNMAKTGKGYWWAGYTPDWAFGLPGAATCDDEPFWVDIGDPPPPEHRNAVTPDVLAELAYRRIVIPTGGAEMKPAAGNQFVNFPTWVWMDTAEFHPVSVTASLPTYGISATTTATPVGIHIDPGSLDARTFPASGDCKGTGTAYAKGAKGDPPCGVEFLQDSGQQKREITVSVTWDISWTGTGHPNPQALPSGTFPSHQYVTVREIQSVTR